MTMWIVRQISCNTRPVLMIPWPSHDEETISPPAMLEFEVRVMRPGGLLLGASCMSGTPAATMRAMYSSGSIVRDVAFTVSMKDAAEYCKPICAPQALLVVSPNMAIR